MMWRAERGDAGERGFTIIELVVVIGVIATVFALVISSIGQVTQTFTLRRAATLLLSELRRAHALSMAEGLDYIVEFDTVTGSNPSNGIKVFRYGAPDCATPCLVRQVRPPNWPSNVQLSQGGTQFPACPSLAGLDTSNECAIFKPLGYAAAAGDVKLKTKAAAQAKWQVIVESATGRVTVARE
jgi:prepilin-type N-terminal cleavage/methylation domain-containing protein